MSSKDEKDWAVHFPDYWEELVMARGERIAHLQMENQRLINQVVELESQLDSLIKALLTVNKYQPKETTNER